MKKFFLIVPTILYCLATAGQQFSENGYFVATENTIRVLVVYAQIDYTDCPGENEYGLNDEWPDGSAPLW